MNFRLPVWVLVVTAVVAFMLGFWVGVPVGRKDAQAMTVHVHRLNLEDNMLAVTVRTDITVKRATTATILADGMVAATHSAGHRAIVKRVRLHKGRNRFGRTLFVQRWDEEIQQLPYSPWRPSYRFIPVATPLDAVLVELRVGGRLVGEGEGLMASSYYDRSGVAISQEEWISCLGVDSNCQIANETVGDATVSTVWLGLNHQFGAGPPLIFETMIFGGDHDQSQWRYSTEDAARANHDCIVAALEAGADPKPGEES